MLSADELSDSPSAKPPSAATFRHILPEQLESLGLVASIVQDKQGFMWFGGANGLARYDGYNLEIHRRDDNKAGSISANQVNHMMQTRSGQLWVATVNGLNLYRPKTDTFVRYKISSDAGDSDDLRHLLEDRQGRIWLASTSGFYQFDPETGVATRIHALHADDVVADEVVWTMAEDQDGILWVGHNARGVSRYDPVTGEVRHYRYDPTLSADAGLEQPDGLTHNTVRKLFVDSRNMLWVGTLGGGLHRLDREQDQFVPVQHHPSEKSDTVLDINEDENGLIWLGDGTSVHVFNPISGDYSRFRFSESDPTGPGNHVVRAIYQDNNYDMWIGYFPAGVDLVDKRASVFRNYGHKPDDPNTIADGGVLTGYEDAQENLWIGAGFGLNYYDRARGQFTRYEHDPEDPTTMSGSTVLSITEDPQQRLWVGIWDRGLNRRDEETGHFIHYLPDPEDPGAIVGREPWDLLVDHQGVLWVVTEAALNRYDSDSDSFTAYRPAADQLHGDSQMYGRTLYEDGDDNIWIGGVHGLHRFDRQSGTFTQHYSHDEDDPASLGANFVWSIFEDSREQLWVGTNGGGLNRFDPASGQFTLYGVEDGLADPVVTGIVEDEAGYLWLSGMKGLSRFDTQDGSFRHYDKRNGLNGNLFNRNSPIRLRSGELFFGNSRGFVLFYPDELGINTTIPPVVLTNFLVFNQPVSVGGDDSPIQQTITTGADITLDYSQSVFSFQFAALNFRSPQENQYAYRLDGFDEQWNYVGNKRTATYTNLDPGEYVFRVKASNNDGVWNETGTAVRLEILPPLWRTWWAYVLYGLLILGLVYWVVRNQQIKLAYERQRVEQERSLVKRLRAFDKLKDDFLANTSHELRTPLHGIVGLAQSLLDGVTGKLPEAVRENLQMIVASGNRLTSLVNDILDFSKLENKGISIHKKHLDLHVLVDVVLGLSRPLVGAKPLRLKNSVPKDLPTVEADEDRIIQVLHNLVGNAIKFTEQGEVNVHAERAGDYIRVSVSDTGIGIAEDQLDTIFDAFHQVEDSVRRSQGGAGLGLLISKKLVELQGGSISVQSSEHGSSFSFTVPQAGAGLQPPTQKALKSEPSVSESLISDPLAVPDDLPGFALAETSPGADEAPRARSDMELVSKLDANILIVDDDPVNRKVLSNYLALKNYNVLEASGGEEALAIVGAEPVIDLVLLDIMMPRMSGYDVCRKLREHYPPQELPVIFLTARSQTDDLVTGFALGANDFLTKPITREELLARVYTHLQLLDIHRNLDRKVSERTAELGQKNERLKQMQDHLEEVNAKLEEASLTDPLTGLRNRRFLNKFVDSDTSMAARQYLSWISSNQAERPANADLVFMLLDVDFFKAINDRYGHTAGDRLLEQLSDLLRQHMRDSDYVIRWGGEEFLLVIRCCEREQAAEMAERIRQSIASYRFAIDDSTQVQVTCSIGFAAYPFYPKAPSLLSWEQVIDVADRGLYAAKNAGRNCYVCIASGEQDEGEYRLFHTDEDLIPLVAEGQLRLVASKPDSIVKL